MCARMCAITERFLVCANVKAMRVECRNRFDYDEFDRMQINALALSRLFGGT